MQEVVVLTMVLALVVWSVAPMVDQEPTLDTFPSDISVPLGNCPHLDELFYL
jgi:hypothetical protein